VFLFCFSSSLVPTLCCQFLWIVHFVIAPSVFSNVYFTLIKIKWRRLCRCFREPILVFTISVYESADNTLSCWQRNITYLRFPHTSMVRFTDLDDVCIRHSSTTVCSFCLWRIPSRNVL